jgi:hypothetical protein
VIRREAIGFASSAELPCTLRVSSLAWLELEEIDPGRFDVRFYLPVQSQMMVKATPILPSVCVEAAPRQVSYCETECAESWQVGCGS